MRNWHSAETVLVAGNMDGIDVCVKPRVSHGFGRIQGKISQVGSTSSATPSQGALVLAVFRPDGKVVNFDMSENDGSFSLDDLPPGAYDIVVDKEGYSASAVRSCTVGGGNSYELSDVTIKISPDMTLALSPLEGFVPLCYNLRQNYPNPFNPTTEITFDLPKASAVSLRIYNLIGQEIDLLTFGDYASGEYSVSWNGVDRGGEALGSGVYFVKLVAAPLDGTGTVFSQLRKLILLR